MSVITHTNLEIGKSYTLVGDYKNYSHGTILGTLIDKWSPPHGSGEEDVYYTFESVDNGSKKIIELENYWLDKFNNTFILVQVQ